MRNWNESRFSVRNIVKNNAIMDLFKDLKWEQKPTTSLLSIDVSYGLKWDSYANENV